MKTISISRLRFQRRVKSAATCALAFCIVFSPFLQAAKAQQASSPAKANIVARIDFNPKINGFGFQNYTNSKHHWQDDLNAGDMIRLFGAGAVCQKGNSAQNCVMKAAAREWMMQVLENMNIGHCDGMATTSLLLATKKPFKGKVSPSQFQPAAETPFQLKLDPVIENYIAYYWATQTLPEIRNQRTKSRTDGPLAVVKTLVDSLKSGRDVQTLIFWKSDKGKLAAGHVVSPFAVEDAGTFYRIHVYDNNYPGQTRFITVDKAGKQTWKYVTTTNPSQPVSAYTGDITTKSLATTSNATREKGCFNVPFANDGKGGACVPVKEAFMKPAPAPRKPVEYTAPARPKKPAQPKPVTSEVEFYQAEMAEFALNGYADMLVVDGEGYAVGVDPTSNEFVDEIPYSEIDWQTGGKGFDTPRYSLPFKGEGAPYTILISGRNNTKETNVDFTYSGPGFTIGFDGILVDPNEIIAMTISPDAEQISFTSSADGETPEIYYAVDSGSNSTKIELDGGKLKPGKTLTVNYNIQNSIFNFYDNDGDNDDYDVDFTRYNADGTVWYYETDNLNFGTNDRYQMDFSEWDGDGAVGAKVDEEGDGFDDGEYTAQPDEDNDNDADDADDEGDDEDSDIDNDGILNAADPDDDNDGLSDAKDSDDDNDGLSDSEDSDNEDDDGDGIYDDKDPDDDNDGTPDDKDIDDDNDGVSDEDEDGEYNEAGEEDEVVDDDDDDNDGIPDSKDSDDDNDGIPDGEDEDTTDVDGDGILDDEDPDDDNDGIPDDKDPDDDNDGTPEDEEEDGDEEYDANDIDGDGISNDKDDDDDNDGISDDEDEDDDNDGEPDSDEEEDEDGDGDNGGDNRIAVFTQMFSRLF